MKEIGAGVDIAVDASEDLRVNTFIIGYSKHIVDRAVDTSANAMVAAALEESVEGVAQSDIVHLQEGSVLDEAIRAQCRPRWS